MKKPIVLCVILIIVDQITKYLVSIFIGCDDFINIIPFLDFFNLVNVRNTGTAFSMLQGQNFIFSLGIFFILILIILFLSKSWEKMSLLWRYSFCLIISGGIGNLIDRIFCGAVIDFLDFGINSLRWPSFNIADSCICIAVCIMIFDILGVSKNPNVL